jgi:hypothetical protein
MAIMLIITTSSVAVTEPLAAGTEWQPIEMENLLVQAGTALDFSEAIPRVAPCGIKGRVIVNDEGKLAFTQIPDTLVRFNGFVLIPHRLFYWPVNLYQLSVSERNHTLEDYADGIVRQGYNLVRLHGVDASLIYGTQTTIYPIPTRPADIPFRSDAVDMFHYFIYCLKERGVYVTMDLMQSKAGYTSCYPYASDLPADDFRQMMYADSVRRLNWKAGVTKLLSMVNPYTGTTLASDPIVTFVVFNNEQHFTWAQTYCDALDSKWKQWVQTKYPTPQQLCAAWPTLNLNPSTAYQNIPSLSETAASGSDMLADDMTTFVAEVENDLNTFYEQTVRNLGYTGLMTNFNNKHTFARVSQLAKFDLIANHPYFAHPSGNLVDQSSSLMPRINGWGTGMSWFIDRPYVVTEYNHVFWNPYRHEQGIYFHSVASLQDWSSVSMNGETAFPLHRAMEPFRNQDDPIARAAAAYGVFAYGRGDVQPASTTVAVRITDDDIQGHGFYAPGNYTYWFWNLSMICRTGTLYAGEFLRTSIYPDMEISPFNGMVRSILGVPQSGTQSQTLDSLVDLMRSNNILSSSNQSDPAQHIYQSETNEIFANGNTGVMKVITPRLEGLTIKTNTQVSGDKLVVKSCSVPASVAAISLNADETVETSSRLLLLISTDALNTGMTFTDSSHGEVVDMGTLPVLMHTGQFELEIQNTEITLPALYSLKVDGTRMDKLPISVKNGKLIVAIDTADLPNGPTPFFEIVQGENWSFIEYFNSDLSTNWILHSQNSTVGITTDPYSGPGGSCVRLCMGSQANKLAYITLNQSLTYNEALLNVSFDLGYNKTDRFGWYHGFSVLNDSGAAVLRAGHTGWRGEWTGGTLYQGSFLLGNQSATQLSPDGIRHEPYTWYRYVLSITPAESVLKVYPWTSSDPDAYVSVTPIWQGSTAGLAAGNYTLAFINTDTSIDTFAQSRDFMYVDNVYFALSELTPGDANNDGMVDVGDLGILAANYGVTNNATWIMGDFNGDGAVDVGDLGILAAHYGTNASNADWTTDYAKAFGPTVTDNTDEGISNSACRGLGLPLIAGFLLMSMILMKRSE